MKPDDDNDGDPFDLARFVEAQDRSGAHAAAPAELRAGRKRSHWMWFVFPQLAGLGRSEMSRRYAIGSLGEARAYLAHPLLGGRLRELAAILLELDGPPPPAAVFGNIDAAKLRSSMTLFARADPGERSFAAVLDRYFAGERDRETERLLAR